MADDPRPDHRRRAASRRTFLTQLAGAIVAPAVAGLRNLPGIETALERDGDRRGPEVGGVASGQARSAESAPQPAAHRLGAIGIQTYTVRHVMEKDPNRTLAALAQIGYTQVELIKADVAHPSEMRKLLDENHLKAPSGHLTITDMRQNWPLALDNAAIMGQSYIVCAWVPENERTADDWKRIAAELNTLGETSRRHGIQLAYHNHSFEWTPAGSLIPYEILLTECDAQLVQMEIDIMHMVEGGQNPVTYFTRYPGRFPLLHVKDMNSQREMVDVGKGMIDFGAIFAKAAQGGVKYYFVEYDNPPDPIADARVCYDYLRQLRF